MKFVSTVLVMILSFSDPIDGWELFSRVRFTSKFFKEANTYYLVPEIDASIKSYEGKQVTLQGYYMPFELETKNAFVISQNPFAACFFCGGAGPESIAEVIVESKQVDLEVDQFVTVTGTLKFNDSDMDRLNFIVEHAEIKAH